ncbi:MAG: AAA family ATPase [Selenomonas sp.]|nr:AAA family ATPase [Selenomonas sp.]
MIQRPFYLDQLRRWREKDVIKVLTGIRRCGKSTLLSMFRKELRQSGVPEENIISLNLEGIEGIDITESRQLLQYFVERLQPHGMNYIFTQTSQVQNAREALQNLNL